MPLDAQRRSPIQAVIRLLTEKNVYAIQIQIQIQI
jgi:hypothetical protein